jgi:hypothetical protein
MWLEGSGLRNRKLSRQFRKKSGECINIGYRATEFATKLRAGHHFLSTVMQERKIFLIGDEHELCRVAEERVDSAKARRKRMHPK